MFFLVVWTTLGAPSELASNGVEKPCFVFLKRCGFIGNGRYGTASTAGDVWPLLFLERNILYLQGAFPLQSFVICHVAEGSVKSGNHSTFSTRTERCTLFIWSCNGHEHHGKYHTKTSNGPFVHVEDLKLKALVKLNWQHPTLFSLHLIDYTI